jgi:hypothetical protein
MKKQDKVKVSHVAEMKVKSLIEELGSNEQEAKRLREMFMAGYQIRALESDQEIENLLTALKFYADRNTYSHGICFSEENLLAQEDMTHIDGHLVGGKTARESLTLFKRGRGWK